MLRVLRNLIAMRQHKLQVRELLAVPPWEWPKGTDALLLEVLQDDKANPADRLAAAKLAGDLTVTDDKLVKALLAVVRDGAASEELRSTAAISLGPVLEMADTEGFEDPENDPITEPTYHATQAALRELFADVGVPGEVRRRILEASVRAPCDWHAEAIRAAWSCQNEAWMLTAVFCMRYVSGFEPQIVAALKSRNSDIHYEAVIAAGNWEVAAAWKHVLALVSAPTTKKRLLLAAIGAVGSLGPSRAQDALGHLLDSEDEDVVEAVTEALDDAEFFGDEDMGEDEDLTGRRD